jgi:ribonuclease HI
LLTTGPKVITVYADASYTNEAGIGCWVYTIPSFPILRFGIEAVCSNNVVELAAVVNGLTTAVTVDLTHRPVQVHTDSEYVIGVMEYVVKRVALPDRKSYRPIAKLYSQACDVTAGRALTVRLRRAGNPHHAACDRKARQELRRYCSDGSLAHTILLRRAETRRNHVMKQIRTLEESLNQLQTTLLKCDMEVAALRYTPFRVERLSQ